MLELPDLTTGQYSTVYNALSMVIAVNGAVVIYLLFTRTQVAARFRPALVVSALVCGISVYHYLRILGNFESAFELSGGGYVPSGEPFNAAYRYIDWLITVPLLLTELVAVLALTKVRTRSLLTKLIGAAVAMIVLGFPGEIASADQTGQRLLWGTLSTIPFLYLLYVLFVELGKAAGDQSDEVKVKLRNLRLLLIGTWGVYPVAFLFPVFDSDPNATLFIARDVGYSVADMLAKGLFGVLIAGIAKVKTQVEDPAFDTQSVTASAEQTAATGRRERPSTT